jgi:23S rRNA (cytidine2498-2'-O)-methyltransferase
MQVLAFCSPAYEDAALNELAATIGARLEERPVTGLLVLQCALAADEAASRVAASPPIFTRHLVLDVMLVAGGGDLEAVVEGVCTLPIATEAEAVLVWDGEGRIGPEEQNLRERILRRLQIDRSGNPWRAEAPVLLVVHAAGRWYAGTALLGAGLLPSREVLWERYAWGLPGRASGRPDLPLQAEMVSRSALKLLEALETFGMEVRAGERALDLGAAPGGWTQVLARRGVLVTAVDPAALDPRVARLPGVSVAATTAQAYFRVSDDRFDLIVNDMRLDARESARLMVEAAMRLRSTGSGLLTLKLPERAPTSVVRQALATLGHGYAGQRARCLFYNRHEVTVHVTGPRVMTETTTPPVRREAVRRLRPRSALPGRRPSG